MLKGPGMLEQVDNASAVDLPPRFEEALEQIRAVMARCDNAGIPDRTTLAALLTELMPRLVRAHGPQGVASLLSQLSAELSSDGP